MSQEIAVKKFSLSLLILAIILTAWPCTAFNETIRIRDNGFDGTQIRPDAIMVHSNHNVSELIGRYLGYNDLINEIGDRERWVPEGATTKPYEYNDTWLVYHGGKGIWPGNSTTENMNLRTLGIGLYYPQDAEPETLQMLSLAELVTNYTVANPAYGTYKGIQYIFGQNVTAGYRLGGNTVFDGQRYRINTDKDAVPLNPWNFPMEKFANLLNEEGKPHNLSWKLVSGNGTYNNTTSDMTETWPIQYLEREKAIST